MLMLALYSKHHRGKVPPCRAAAESCFSYILPYICNSMTTGQSPSEDEVYVICVKAPAQLLNGPCVEIVFSMAVDKS